MRVGILGAGQLSRMLALAGIPLGLSFAFYAPAATESVKYLGQTFLGEYDDLQALASFLKEVDVVTYENENIPPATLEFILQSKALHPGVNAISVMQDRLLEKQFFNQLKVPTTQYDVIDNLAQLKDACAKHRLPLVLKKRTQGYDGKGQVVIKDAETLATITEAQCQGCILEEFIPYQREVSLVGARDAAGQMVFYDISENVHQQGILIRTRNKVNDPHFANAKTHLTAIMQSLNYVGICALEFFERDGELVANEMAPRVHNTGHWTIEGAVISQFENHLRAILGWPLGATTSYGDFEMTNIIGEMPDPTTLTNFDVVNWHDYKKAPRPGRKLGQMTVSRSRCNRE